MHRSALMALAALVPNIFHARAGDYRAATHRIARSARYPSHVEIAVLP